MGVGVTETRWKTPPARIVDDALGKSNNEGGSTLSRAGRRSRAHPPSTGRDHVTASAVPKSATAAARAARRVHGFHRLAPPRV